MLTSLGPSTVTTTPGDLAELLVTLVEARAVVVSLDGRRASAFDDLQLAELRQNIDHAVAFVTSLHPEAGR